MQHELSEIVRESTELSPALRLSRVPRLVKLDSFDRNIVRARAIDARASASVAMKEAAESLMAANAHSGAVSSSPIIALAREAVATEAELLARPAAEIIVSAPTQSALTGW